MPITYSCLHKINSNQSKKKDYSLSYPNIQNLHGFQAVPGRTRPVTNTKTENQSKYQLRILPNFFQNVSLPFLHGLVRPYINF